MPDDVSVMGFDDIDIARYYVPALTTIRQQTRALGVEAAATLLSRLNGTNTDSDTTIRLLDVELIERSSTGPVPS